MKKITDSQLISETIEGLNFLSTKLDSNEYNGGIIGPLVSSLFLTVLLVHADYKKKEPSENNLLKEFYEFSSKKELTDFEIIGCMRHALAHSNFSFERDNLIFHGNKYGTVKIPYTKFTTLINKVFDIYIFSNTLTQNDNQTLA